jgi:hypothetical protein
MNLPLVESNNLFDDRKSNSCPRIFSTFFYPEESFPYFFEIFFADADTRIRNSYDLIVVRYGYASILLIVEDSISDNISKKKRKVFAVHQYCCIFWDIDIENDIFLFSSFFFFFPFDEKSNIEIDGIEFLSLFYIRELKQSIE